MVRITQSSPLLSALLRSEGLLSIDCRTGETAGIFSKSCIICSPVLLKIPTDSPTHRTSGHRACHSYERHLGLRTFKEKRSRSAARRCYVPEPWGGSTDASSVSSPCFIIPPSLPKGGAMNVRAEVVPRFSGSA